MNINADWWNKNKAKLALAPAIIFWLVSMVCFVFGLSFKNPLGILIGNIDISLVVAISLSLANTFVQIVGNDQKREDMDTLFYLGWMASYLLGIGSNVNTLLGILGFGNVYIEWAVCIGLGTMIEVLPEKLLVQFLHSVGGTKYHPAHVQTTYNNQPKPQYQQTAQKFQSIPKNQRPDDDNLQPLADTSHFVVAPKHKHRPKYS